jgi:hypothetical protein
MKIIPFLVLSAFTLTSFIGKAQEEAYQIAVAKADSLFAAANYSLASENYEQAFKRLDGKAYSSDRYQAACAFALSGNKKKAFYHLHYLADHAIEQLNLDPILVDERLQSLHEKKAWRKLLNKFAAYQQKLQENHHLIWIRELDSIYQRFLKVRSQLQEVSEEYLQGSFQLENAWVEYRETNWNNEQYVLQLLEENGWLGKDRIGENGSAIIFLILQNAQVSTLEKILPIMQKGVADGKADASQWAFLSDRWALQKGELQTYGTQLGESPKDGSPYVLPMIQPEKVDERRAALGLPSQKEYLKKYAMDWDVEAYIKRLPTYKKWYYSTPSFRQ